MPGSERSVSLSDELWVLFQGVQGARALVEKFTQNQHSDEREEAETAHAVVAVLVMITERLRLLDRIVRGSVDSALILCRQNEAVPAEGAEPHDGEEDIVLPVWSEKRLLCHHKAEWRRAKRRLVQVTAEGKGSQ